jgi:hypothetical protein
VHAADGEGGSARDQRQGTPFALEDVSTDAGKIDLGRELLGDVYRVALHCKIEGEGIISKEIYIVSPSTV